MKRDIGKLTLLVSLAMLFTACASTPKTRSAFLHTPSRCRLLQAAAEQQPKPRPARTYRYAHGRMRRTSRISPDCFGLTKQEVATTLRRNHRNIATCYHKHVGLSCSHRMQIDIHVRLRRDGEVTKATITQRTFYSASFESCLLQKVQQWKFPNLRSRTFAFTYPLLFR